MELYSSLVCVIVACSLNMMYLILIWGLVINIHRHSCSCKRPFPFVFAGIPAGRKVYPVYPFRVDILSTYSFNEIRRLVVHDDYSVSS